MVVVVGETVWDPFNATDVPFKSALTAFFVVHVSVELPPEAMVLGSSVIPAAGGPLEFTVTVAWAEVFAPAELVATKL